jgi:hypothetical protein
VREDIINVVGLAKSEGRTSTIPNDTTFKKPSGLANILDVEVGGKGTHEVDEDWLVAADETAIVDVDG